MMPEIDKPIIPLIFEDAATLQLGYLDSSFHVNSQNQSCVETVHGFEPGPVCVFVLFID